MSPKFFKDRQDKQEQPENDRLLGQIRDHEIAKIQTSSFFFRFLKLSNITPTSFNPILFIIKIILWFINTIFPFFYFDSKDYWKGTFLEKASTKIPSFYHSRNDNSIFIFRSPAFYIQSILFLISVFIYFIFLSFHTHGFILSYLHTAFTFFSNVISFEGILFSVRNLFFSLVHFFYSRDSYRILDLIMPTLAILSLPALHLSFLRGICDVRFKTFSLACVDVSKTYFLIIFNSIQNICIDSLSIFGQKNENVILQLINIFVIGMATFCYASKYVLFTSIFLKIQVFIASAFSAFTGLVFFIIHVRHINQPIIFFIISICSLVIITVLVILFEIRKRKAIIKKQMIITPEELLNMNNSELISFFATISQYPIPCIKPDSSNSSFHDSLPYRLCEKFKYHMKLRLLIIRYMLHFKIDPEFIYTEATKLIHFATNSFYCSTQLAAIIEIGEEIAHVDFRKLMKFNIVIAFQHQIMSAHANFWYLLLSNKKNELESAICRLAAVIHIANDFFIQLGIGFKTSKIDFLRAQRAKLDENNDSLIRDEIVSFESTNKSSNQESENEKSIFHESFQDSYGFSDFDSHDSYNMPSEALSENDNFIQEEESNFEEFNTNDEEEDEEFNDEVEIKADKEFGKEAQRMSSPFYKMYQKFLSYGAIDYISLALSADSGIKPELVQTLYNKTEAAYKILRSSKPASFLSTFKYLHFGICLLTFIGLTITNIWTGNFTKYPEHSIKAYDYLVWYTRAFDSTIVQALSRYITFPSFIFQNSENFSTSYNSFVKKIQPLFSANSSKTIYNQNSSIDFEKDCQILKDFNSNMISLSNQIPDISDFFMNDDVFKLSILVMDSVIPIFDEIEFHLKSAQDHYKLVQEQFNLISFIFLIIGGALALGIIIGDIFYLKFLYNFIHKGMLVPNCVCGCLYRYYKHITESLVHDNSFILSSQKFQDTSFRFTILIGDIFIQLFLIVILFLVFFVLNNMKKQQLNVPYQVITAEYLSPYSTLAILQLIPILGGRKQSAIFDRPVLEIAYQFFSFQVDNLLPSSVEYFNKTIQSCFESKYSIPSFIYNIDISTFLNQIKEYYSSYISGYDIAISILEIISREMENQELDSGDFNSKYSQTLVRFIEFKMKRNEFQSGFYDIYENLMIRLENVQLFLLLCFQIISFILSFLGFISVIYLANIFKIFYRIVTIIPYFWYKCPHSLHREFFNHTSQNDIIPKEEKDPLNLLSEIPIGIIILDRYSQIIFVNQAALCMPFQRIYVGCVITKDFLQMISNNPNYSLTQISLRKYPYVHDESRLKGETLIAILDITSRRQKATQIEMTQADISLYRNLNRPIIANPCVEKARYVFKDVSIIDISLNEHLSRAQYRKLLDGLPSILEQCKTFVLQDLKRFSICIIFSPFNSPINQRQYLHDALYCAQSLYHYCEFHNLFRFIKISIVISNNCLCQIDESVKPGGSSMYNLSLGSSLLKFAKFGEIAVQLALLSEYQMRNQYQKPKTAHINGKDVKYFIFTDGIPISSKFIV